MRADAPGLDLQRRQRGFRHVDQLGRVGHHLHQQQIAQVAQVVADELPQVLTLAGDLVEEQECGAGALADDGLVQRHELVQGHGAEDGQGVVQADGLSGIGVSHDLVEQAEGVAHAPLSLAGDGGQGLGRHADAVLLAHRLQPPDDLPSSQTVEVVALAAGGNGDGDLVCLGGGQHEGHVPRRLLQRFQQGVEGGLGQHMNLVDDVDLVLEFSRGKLDVVPQAADVVDATVRGGVDFDDVHALAAVDVLTGGALVARLAVLRDLAVERLGDEARHGGLAGAAGTRQQVRMRKAPLGQSVSQRTDDMLLAHQVGKGLGAPLTVQGQMGHAGTLHPHRFTPSNSPPGGSFLSPGARVNGKGSDR